MTAGIIALNSDILVSDSKFHNFKAGGIFLSGNNDTSIKIADSEINKCGIVGVYSQGEDCKPLFLRLKINNIEEGPGIKIYKANRAKIKGCDITKCQTGVEVICGDPYIVLNKIFQNYENGILTISKGDLRCDALIKFNEIIKNKDNGILCCGDGKIYLLTNLENHTKIYKNNTIANNRRAGIKAIEGAHISIYDNTIKSNFCQGILLVEGTSAHIELNEIKMNFKANIAFGGDKSADTVIINNKIFSSRSEGIFILEAGFSLIYINEIYDNNDGVIMYDSN
jgi:nitrous oxidase accessory protein NosD